MSFAQNMLVQVSFESLRYQIAQSFDGELVADQVKKTLDAVDWDAAIERAVQECLRNYIDAEVRKVVAETLAGMRVKLEAIASDAAKRALKKETLR